MVEPPPVEAPWDDVEVAILDDCWIVFFVKLF